MNSCIAFQLRSLISQHPTISLLSLATFITTYAYFLLLPPLLRTLASFFAYICEQFVYLYVLSRGGIFYMMREHLMSLVEPVDDTLEVDAESSTHCSEAHPFQTHLYSLCFESRVITHRFLVRSEVTSTTLTTHTFGACVIGACVIGACFDYSIWLPAIWARRVCCLHTPFYHSLHFSSLPCNRTGCTPSVPVI